jgi:hypothetical protein
MVLLGSNVPEATRIEITTYYFTNMCFFVDIYTPGMIQIKLNSNAEVKGKVTDLFWSHFNQ